MNPGDTEFPPICAECREPLVKTKVGKGKKAQLLTVCACNPLPVPEPKVLRKVKNTARKGREGEVEFVKLATDAGWDAYRTAGSGAHGSRNNESSQDTDVVIRAGNDRVRFKVECKRLSKVPGQTSLEGLRSRSEILWVRQDQSDGYVWMPASIFKAFMAYAAEALK